MKLEFKILFNRDNHSNDVQKQIIRAKDYMSLATIKEIPYFCNVGFCGGGGLEDEQTSFNIVCFIYEDVALRLNIYNQLKAIFKGATIYYFQDNQPPTLIS